jgi:hypothetical protein
MSDQLSLDVAEIYLGSEAAQIPVRKNVAASFGHYAHRDDLSIPEPQKIRAGRAGGLPFDSLTTDLFLGCLSAAEICYGNCFAARAAFQSGFDYGTRVENMLDEDLFLSDVAMLPVSQRYLKNGWNSDPSWNWRKAVRLAELISSAGLHTVFITKCFTKLDDGIMSELAKLRVDLRVSVSAFDSRPQFEHRLRSMEEYRRKGGVSIPQLFTTQFKDPALNARQDKIARHLVDLDFPAAENSLRIDPASPVAELLDKSECGRVAGTDDLWCGRLYPDVLLIPAMTAMPPWYVGLQSSRLSENEPSFINSLWHDWIPTHSEVLAGPSLRKPLQCGVSLRWENTDKASKLMTPDPLDLPNGSRAAE